MIRILYLKELIIKIIKSIIGYIIISFGNVLMIYADLGLNSWGILHQGISMQTPLTFGQALQALGITIIVICFLFGLYPGLGTILNMYFVGLFTDTFKNSSIFVIPDSIFLKFIMLLVAILAIDIGMFIYLREAIGAGPKDGLMLLLTKKTRFNIGLVRTCMELTAIFIGFMLGGKFGIGTIIAAVSLGPGLKFLFKTFKYDPKKVEHESLFDTLKRLKASKTDTSA